MNAAQQVKAPNMARWSDAKLSKEIAVSIPANDGSRESAEWMAALKAEAKRRGWDIQ
jgi:hypothetical protein